MKVHKIITRPYVISCKGSTNNLVGVRDNKFVRDIKLPNSYLYSAKTRNNQVIVFNNEICLMFSSTKRLNELFNIISPAAIGYFDQIHEFNNKNADICKIDI